MKEEGKERVAKDETRPSVVTTTLAQNRLLTCEASACSTEFPTPPIIGDDSAIPCVRAAPGDGVFNSFDEAPVE